MQQRLRCSDQQSARIVSLRQTENGGGAVSRKHKDFLFTENNMSHLSCPPLPHILPKLARLSDNKNTSDFNISVGNYLLLSDSKNTSDLNISFSNYLLVFVPHQSGILLRSAASLWFSYCQIAHVAMLQPEKAKANMVGRTKVLQLVGGPCSTASSTSSNLGPFLSSSLETFTGGDDRTFCLNVLVPTCPAPKL